MDKQINGGDITTCWRSMLFWHSAFKTTPTTAKQARLASNVRPEERSSDFVYTKPKVIFGFPINKYD